MKTKPTYYEKTTIRTVSKIIGILAGTLTTVIITTSPCYAGKINVTISGREAIFLAGRDDVVIPPLGQQSFLLGRHDFVAFDFRKERFPTGIVVRGGDTIKVLKRARGRIDFFNAPSATFSLPEGGINGTAFLDSLGGISGYTGPTGALVGVFLDNANPAESATPTTLDFSSENQNLTLLSPALGQIFFIGDGITSAGALQRFIAPFGATRLFLGIPDGFGFTGAPGAYEDNNGEYRIELSVAE